MYRKMDIDIGHILSDWPYEPGQVTARRVHGEDGRDKIQLRLDLGILQMEVSGRPDGRRPHGRNSLLAHYEHKLKRYREEHNSDEGFELDERACELLRAEGVMYYHRYLAEFVLEDFEGVERDTTRNLQLFDFCNAYAKEESDRYILERYRPYVIMMCARARGRAAIRDNRPKAGLAAVRKGIKRIKAFYERFGQENLVEASPEITILQAMADDVKGMIPVDPIRRLQHRLDEAVRQERYEDAASLRDQLRRAAEGGRKGQQKA